MKQKRLSTGQQIKNLKSLIKDGIKLGFNKKLLANYNKQLRELEVKKTSKGIELKPTEFKALANRVIKKAENKVLNPVLTFSPLHKTVYVGGIGFIREDLNEAREKEFKRFFRRLNNREKKQQEVYIQECNAQ